VFEEYRERLSVSKHVTQKLDMNRSNLKKLSTVEVREQYRLNISNGCAFLKKRDDRGLIHRVWENMC
jgi:hypothetical protein